MKIEERENLKKNLSKSTNGGQDDEIVRVNEGIRPALAVDIVVLRSVKPPKNDERGGGG